MPRTTVGTKLKDETIVAIDALAAAVPAKRSAYIAALLEQITGTADPDGKPESEPAAVAVEMPKREDWIKARAKQIHGGQRLPMATAQRNAEREYRERWPDA